MTPLMSSFPNLDCLWPLSQRLFAGPLNFMSLCSIEIWAVHAYAGKLEELIQQLWVWSYKTIWKWFDNIHELNKTLWISLPNFLLSGIKELELWKSQLSGTWGKPTVILACPRASWEANMGHTELWGEESWHHDLTPGISHFRHH